jgi:hydroxymethylpyrimidine kinase/phosphomethylpyrimidine kinase
VTVWLVGGIDPTGGAGLDRDEATARAVAPELSTHRIVTAHTRQGHGPPAEASVVEPAQLTAVAASLPPPRVIKVGLVPAAVADAVTTLLQRHAVPRIVDPVLAASDGGTMGVQLPALQPVLAAATVLTPNRPEASRITGTGPDAPDLLDALVAAFPAAWVLLKDGHGDDPSGVRDVLARGRQRFVFARPRIPGGEIRGTGCALATAIACGLAGGADVPEAVARAIAWLDGARRSARPSPDGRLHLQ